MGGYYQTSQNTLFRRIVAATVGVFFVFTSLMPPAIYAQSMTSLGLPTPGAMVPLTPEFQPPIVKGMTIHPDNPLQFDFIIDPGEEELAGEVFETESTKLVKYFLAALTTPEDQMWVNLSPYEKDRIIPEGFSQTEMGREMLAQDYLLKQLTASLMHPEEDVGEEFWQRLRQKAKEELGTDDIPANTFHKIWIVPEKAVVYTHENNVFVVESKLKVMLEEDYLALAHNRDQNFESRDHQKSLDTDLIREIFLPEIQHEVNHGKTFASLRQMFNSMILATWYKKHLKNSLLGKLYVDQGKTKGVDHDDPQAHQKIYDQYVAAFKNGVFDYIQEEYDPATQQVIPRKYFSGGVGLEGIKVDTAVLSDNRVIGAFQKGVEVFKGVSVYLKGFRKGAIKNQQIPKEVTDAWSFSEDHNPDDFTYVIKVNRLKRFFVSC